MTRPICTKNLEREIAGRDILWREREDLALASLRRLKALAAEIEGELWPNHDLAHWRRLVARGWPTLAARPGARVNPRMLRRAGAPKGKLS